MKCLDKVLDEDGPPSIPPRIPPSQQPHNPQDTLYPEGMPIGLVLCQLRDMRSSTWWI